jgi:hypothetical protein
VLPGKKLCVDELAEKNKLRVSKFDGKKERRRRSYPHFVSKELKKKREPSLLIIEHVLCVCVCVWSGGPVGGADHEHSTTITTI